MRGYRNLQFLDTGNAVIAFSYHEVIGVTLKRNTTMRVGSLYFDAMWYLIGRASWQVSDTTKSHVDYLKEQGEWQVPSAQKFEDVVHAAMSGVAQMFAKTIAEDAFAYLNEIE